jgi:hypothetical protein
MAWGFFYLFLKQQKRLMNCKQYFYTVTSTICKNKTSYSQPRLGAY